MDEMISRQAAIELHCELCPDNEKCICEYCPDVLAFEALPTAEPRKGEWILQSDTYHEYWECDQCGMGVGLDDVRNYCPNCGARMEESDERD